MTTSNLSKIKTSFRTKGNITGNFGVPKSKAGSPMRDLGVTDVKVVKISTQEDYLQRLHRAYVATDDAKLKKFIFNEIKKIMIQRGEW
jgi:glycyl-tRNA synthetase beta subunit